MQSIKNIIADLKKKRIEIELKESDLEESFVKGGGPGGQAVNKTNNAVWVRHVPTGIQVKVYPFPLKLYANISLNVCM